MLRLEQTWANEEISILEITNKIHVFLPGMRKEYNNCDSFQNVSNCSNIRPWTESWTDLAIPFEFWRYVRIPPAHLLKKESKQDSKGTNSFQNMRLGVMLHCLIQQYRSAMYFTHFHAYIYIYNIYIYTYSYAWLSNLFIGWPCLTFTDSHVDKHTHIETRQYQCLTFGYIWIHLACVKAPWSCKVPTSSHWKTSWRIDE